MTKSRFSVAAIGEVLWDVFPNGRSFGGAPANFACSLAGLCQDRAGVYMISAVGKDELGTAALTALKNHCVETKWVESDDFVTGQVLVELDGSGCASYEFAANTAWDNLGWSNELAEFAPTLDAVCFGTLGQRSDKSRNTIHRFLSATNANSIRIFDINLRPPFYTDKIILDSLDAANVLKLNEEELPILAKLSRITGSEIEIMRQLADQYELRAVALTRGPNGAIVVRGEEVDVHPGEATTVVDTVGAGDAFTAAFALGLLDSAELNAINCRACEIAAFVCSQQGATPQLPLTWRL